jgi:hypothetical protein
MRVSLHHTALELAVLNAVVEATDLIVPLFALVTSCTTLFMCLSLPLSNRPTSHGACPRYSYTVTAKVKVFRKRKCSIEDQGRDGDGGDNDAHGFAAPSEHRSE